MADYTQTLSETIGLFGPGPSTLWGTAIWGADKWGEGTFDMVQSVGKVLAESQALSDSLINSVGKVLSESQSSSDDIDHLYLTLGLYYHEFISKASDGDDQTTTTYTKTTNPSSSYSQTSNPTTVWT